MTYPDKPFAPTEAEVQLADSLPTQIAEWLAERIFKGEIKAEDRLKEEELATLFQTSRAPVREALYLLQVEGLVERLPRRGTVVRAYSEEDIRDLYEVRATLELSAVERLKERWSKRAEAAFTRVLEGMNQAVEARDSKHYSECNTEFHDLLFKFADSKILHRLYLQLGHPLKYLLQSSTQTPEQMHASCDEHQKIVHFFTNGQFDQAKNLLSENVRHGLSRVIELRHHQP